MLSRNQDDYINQYGTNQQQVFLFVIFNDIKIFFGPHISDINNKQTGFIV
jgi:hypothetical protein